jgi:helicase
MTTHDTDILRSYGLDARIEAAGDLLLDDELDRLAVRVQQELPTAPADASRLAEILERMASRSEELDRREGLFASAWTCRRSQMPPAAARDRAIWLMGAYAGATLGGKHLDLAMWALSQPLDDWISSVESDPWQDVLAVRIAVAMLRIARKQGARDDLRGAKAAIDDLRAENTLHISREEDVDPLGEDAQLIALYNLARIVEIVATYTDLREPLNAAELVRRHSRQMVDALGSLPDARLARACKNAASALMTQLELSVWSATADISEALDEHVRHLANAGTTPILELWPAQRDALRDGLSNAAARAVVIEMPTSAGKSLLAEFAIIQARAAYPDRTIAYLVPTRALVNQVSRRLRHDLSYSGTVVEAAVPVAELDGAEEALLKERIDVLISTPEKLDLLIRSGHTAVADLGLVIVDEAHLIREEGRGVVLELLLANLRSERPQVRFVLLTPFAEGAAQLAEWLGGRDSLSVASSWRPTQRAILVARTAPMSGPQRALEVETVSATSGCDFTEGKTTSLGYLKHDADAGRAGISVELAVRAARRGGVLVLCADRRKARSRAVAIHQQLGVRSGAATELLEATVAFAALELGSDNDLPELLNDRVAYHHRGLSPELRQLIELNARDYSLIALAGTTTLAAGLNFPIATVIFDTLNPGNKALSHANFWNIAGRAGRARMDRVGLVAVSCESPAQEQRLAPYLDASQGTGDSALIDALRAPDLFEGEINVDLIRRHPGLSTLFQFLAHAVRSSGQIPGPDALRELLGATLVYRQLETLNEALAENMIRFCERYLEQLATRVPLAQRADGTGFSTPVAAQLTAIAINEHPEWRDGSWWQPGSILGSDPSNLAGAIEALNRLPDLDLTAGTGGVFDAEWTARVALDWVAGRAVEDIAAEHFAKDRGPDGVAAAGSYLYGKLSSNLSWGLGALQRIVMADEPNDDAVAVPSLMFYGVGTRPAARLRMAGAPRPGAEYLASTIPRAATDDVDYRELRRSIAAVTAEQWTAALGPDAPISGAQARFVAAALAGDAK